MEPFAGQRSGRYRPKVVARAPRSIPDARFDALFAQLGSHRDRALVAFWVSTGARASELLGATAADVDPGQQLITVIRKGTRALQPLPAAPDAFVWLRLYQAQLAELVPSGRDEPLWWTLRRPFRALSYDAARAMFTRANALPGQPGIPTVRIPDVTVMFNEDVVRHYQEFLDRRRKARSADEYKPVTNSEWSEFEEHFDRRKVELGGCTRPYGSACQHEHSCLRCPMLAINPKMLPRLDEIEEDLLARLARATRENWLGEVEGIDLTLSFLRQKREETKRLARVAPVELGMPSPR
jgi:hypothetical protein